MSIEEIQARREKRKAEYEAKRKAQLEIDLAALDSAEEEHGFGRVESMPIKNYAEGCPTLVVIKVPEKLFYERHNREVASAKGNVSKLLEAKEKLGQSCMVYPPKGEVRDAMDEAFPGLLISCGDRAVKLAELDSAEEKKG